MASEAEQNEIWNAIKTIPSWRPVGEEPVFRSDGIVADQAGAESRDLQEYLWWEGPTAHSSPDAVYAFEKLVFGTDEPPANLDSVIARFEAALEANGVPEASRRLIYGETMARTLGITPRK